MTEAKTTPPNYIELTADIVAAYVGHNSVPAEELPGLVRCVVAAVSEPASGKGTAEETREVVPAVPIKKSITDEYLISLEDGKRYKALKRHLSGRGLTPEQYREKYNLPRDYPMVAPSYAKKRSELAKTIGLGRMRMGRDTSLRHRRSRVADVERRQLDDAERFVPRWSHFSSAIEKKSPALRWAFPGWVELWGAYAPASGLGSNRRPSTNPVALYTTTHDATATDVAIIAAHSTRLKPSTAEARRSAKSRA